jgi:2-(1,2-epoxy-1,2-dihydrophenyl)acetyl-CoA isomerase
MTDDHLRVDQHGRVRLVTLNRPARLNALSHELLADLRQGLRAADSDSGTRAVVLTGAGRAFSAGADLRAGPSDAEQVLRDYYNPLILDLLQLSTPVIAAVNGIAAGAAVSLALACDLRIAADTTAFQLSFVKVGLVPDAGATWLLPRAVGTARAAEMMLLGRPVPADQALAWGLVNEVTDTAGLLDRALAVAAVLAALPESAGATRRLYQSLVASVAEQLDREATAQGKAQYSPDFAQARRALAAKRPPVPPAPGETGATR